jgi:hypothetical protein
VLRKTQHTIWLTRPSKPAMLARSGSFGKGAGTLVPIQEV